MHDTARPAPTADLAALIPEQRDAGSAATSGIEPEVVAPREAAPERLAFLWAMLGALAGAAVVAAGFLALLSLLS